MEIKSAAMVIGTIGMALGAVSGWTAVGRTAGVATVSPAGASQYSIPLWMPPNMGELEHALALVYSSDQGGGLLGVGWRVAGLSEIHRCHKTWVQDGQVGAPGRAATDRLCLDGQQLRLTSVAYGSTGSTYQTEIETFTRVTGIGTAGNTVASFKVERRDGLIYEYGGTTDSRIEYAGSTTSPRVWALNKISDRSNNSIQFSYTEDNANGSYRIATIQYPYTATGQGPFYRIEFVYEARPVSDPSVISPSGGGMVREVNQLDRIDIYADSGGWQLIRRYDLGYDTSAASGRSRLQQVQECAASDCLPATTFSYTTGSLGVGAATLVEAVMQNSLPIDVNGDGYQDLVYPIAGANFEYRLGDANGSLSVAGSAAATGLFPNTALPIDWESDGRMDFIARNSAGEWQLAKFVSAGAPFSLTQLDIPATGAGGSAWTGDLDGDGRTDLLFAQTGAAATDPDLIYWRRNSDAGFEAAQVWYNSQVSNLSWFGSSAPFGNSQRRYRTPVRIADFNGDGAEDLLVYLRTNVNEEDGGSPQWRYGWTAVMSGVGEIAAFGTSTTNNGADIDPIATDLNGDGCADLMWAAPSGTWSRALSRCGAPTPFLTASTGISTANHDRAVMIDWDGDGRTDLLQPANGVWYWWRSLGDSFAAGQSTGIGEPGAGQTARVADVNGDGAADLLYSVSNYQIHVQLRSSGRSDLLAGVVDGYGNQVAFAQRPINAGTDACYSRDSVAPLVFPSRAYLGPYYVTCSVTSSNGIGGSYTVQYGYRNANLDLQGRGFLGFERRQARDARNQLLRVETFRQDFPYIGLPVREQILQSDGTTVISDRQITWAAHLYLSGYESRALPFASQTIDRDYELGSAFNGQLLRTSTTTNTVDSNSGTAYDITTTIVEGSTANGLHGGQSHTSRTYHPDLFTDTQSWCLGRPETTQQINSHELPGGASLTRTTAMTWDGTKCRPMTSTIEPLDSRWQVTTTYGYDTFGNLESVTVTPVAGQGQDPRTSMIDWGSDGRAPRELTNAIGHTTTNVWDFDASTSTCPSAPAVLGGLRCSIDANNLTTRWEVDGFGRPTRLLKPDGTAVRFERTSCAGTCADSDLRLSLQVTARDTLDNILRTDTQYFDAFDRLRYDYRQKIGGGTSNVITTYDELGRVITRSMPFSLPDAPKDMVIAYDEIGRPIRITRPANEAADLIEEFNYDGLQTTVSVSVSAPGNQVRSSTARYDAIGQIIKMSDAAGGGVDYEYNAFGQLRLVRDVSLAETTLTYNVRGLRDSASIPELGTWTFDYYPLGELRWQRDANNRTVSFEYDKLSRPLTRAGAPEEAATWTWDTTANGIGKLNRLDSAGAYFESYGYDNAGRLARTTINADGVAYHYDQSYDPLSGLPATLTYPTSTAGVRFKLRFGYEFGELRSVQDFTNDTAGVVYSEIISTDANGRVFDEVYGNGLRTMSTYDRFSALLEKRESGAGGGASIQDLEYAWNDRGFLIRREDIRRELSEQFFYDALDRLDYSQLDSVTNLDLGYDSMGRITSRVDNDIAPGQSSTTSWYSFNLPQEISGSGGNSSEFQYTADGARWKHEATYGGVAETTLYVGGLMEKVTRGSTTTWRHYIPGSTGAAAIYSRPSSGPASVHYLSRDHLGSVESITNASGALEVALSYGAFGQRRDPSDWSGAVSNSDMAQIAAISRRGFTGHEHLDNLNLIHMNGRVHDPVSGRFRSADPFVQAPYFSQSLNRYSYVFNSPLSYIDPSGFKGRRDPDDDPDARPLPVPRVTLPVHPKRERGWPYNEWDLRGGYTIDDQLYGLDKRGHFDPYKGEVEARRYRAGPVNGAAGFFFPNTVALGERGTPGSWGDFAFGFGKGAWNTLDAFLRARPSGLLMTDLQVGIADTELSGAATFEIAGTIATLGRGSVAKWQTTVARETANFIREMTVLGRYPDYIQNAQASGANYFNLGKLGSVLPSWLVWRLNTRFLDRAIARGDKIVLSRPFNPMRDANSWLADEIAYLESHGYTLTDGIVMMPRP